MMNPRTDKLVRRTAMVATVTASDFLLTADYGPEPNVLDPVSFVPTLVTVMINLLRYPDVIDDESFTLVKEG